MFSLREFRLAVLLLALGSVFSLVGGSYYLKTPAVWSAIVVIIGVPLFVVGLALQGAELKPAPNTTEESPELEKARSQATETQIQIIKDTTRYQYGLTAHLEPALEKLGLESEEDGTHPKLLNLKETLIDGAYALLLTFGSLDITYETWKEKGRQK
ncbi:MAG: DUF2854 domain-containing protein [Alkalinema sp. RU_4_3]|nr:DUF2854 domain-containing protein [Alkalinema sp. RU_4_3]